MRPSRVPSSLNRCRHLTERRPSCITIRCARAGRPLRSTPHVGHRPLQSSRHNTKVGTASSHPSRTAGRRSIELDFSSSRNTSGSSSRPSSPDSTNRHWNESPALTDTSVRHRVHSPLAVPLNSPVKWHRPSPALERRPCTVTGELGRMSASSHTASSGPTDPSSSTARPSKLRPVRGRTPWRPRKCHRTTASFLPASVAGPFRGRSDLSAVGGRDIHQKLAARSASRSKSRCAYSGPAQYRSGSLCH